MGRPRAPHLQQMWRSGPRQPSVPPETSVTRGFLMPPATVGQVTGNPLSDPSVSPRDLLVGQCPLVEVKANDKTIRCLVDTGSQVTMFSETLCKELFSDQQPQGPYGPWLSLRGANGLDIPYIGYLVLDFQVKDVLVPARGVVVVRDNCLGSHRALLGMNVIAACWEQLFQHQKTAPTATSRATEEKGWEQIFADCQRIYAAATQQERSDTARVACRFAITIPAHSEALVWAKLPAQTRLADSCVMVEPHGECSGVEVARGLATAHRGRVPVRVRNLQARPVLLHRHLKLARVTTVDASRVREGPDVRFTEGDGLDANQQLQLQRFLTRWQHVFSTHDEDYGCTDLVTHQIPTGEAAPLRERYRPVPPTLYKEIRTLLQAHLQHLEEVFRALQRYGLKLRPEKCHLFGKEVKFLGHCVSKEGVAPDPDKVAAVQDWPPPKTVSCHSLRSR
ncbi:uncharacterized protein LOC134074827 isoform X2 [Sardina pilchardus]|uniref:uncharacterized protein LOC134074827 isoform X2 n=1 Tax=Sardina pilchardus TaxID=27697 RepID=UPI002E0EC86D